jgi:hypothetical protein
MLTKEERIKEMNEMLDQWEKWIRAVITDATSIHVEDSVALSNRREELIEYFCKAS